MPAEESVVAVLVALIASGAIGAALRRWFPPRITEPQAIATLRAEHHEDREQWERERTDLRQQLTDCRADVRALTDHVHDLREHIASGKAPPPPDWPEGLRV